MEYSKVFKSQDEIIFQYDKCTCSDKNEIIKVRAWLAKHKSCELRKDKTAMYLFKRIMLNIPVAKNQKEYSVCF